MAISLVLVDDHPAVRTGLNVLLDDEPDDYHLPDEDGFTLCLRTRALPEPPRVIVYSAFASSRLAVLAAVAGAAALVSKSTLPDKLLSAIRADGSFPHHGDHLSPNALHEAGAQLEPDDLAILGMLAPDIPPAEIAATLAIDGRWLVARRWAMLERLAGIPARRPTAWPPRAAAPRTHVAPSRLA